MCREPAVIGFQTLVGVPGSGRAVAVHDLDESYAALDHAAGDEELLAKVTGSVLTIATLSWSSYFWSMARQPRVEYPGAIYHVMNRGDRREPIVRGATDGELFVRTLGEACDKAGWQVHAFCLMPNHFHLVMETPQPNLCDGMKWFLGSYTNRFNRRHRLFGHLFSGRYKSLLVDDRDTAYLQTVCQYVHLNPSRAGLIKTTDPLEKHPWSGYPEYLSPPSRRKPWMRIDRLFGEMGIAKDSAAGRRRFAKATEMRRFDEDPEAYAAIRRGWRLGGEEFLERCGLLAARTIGSENYGAERQESLEEHAEQLITEELRANGLKERDLKGMAKGDAAKVRIAVRLRKETVMSFAWIAERLAMGSRSHAQNLVYAAKAGK